MPKVLSYLHSLARLNLGAGPWIGCLPLTQAYQLVVVTPATLVLCGDNAADRQALQAAYTATREQAGWLSLENWGKRYLSLAQWEGMTTNEVGRVIHLDLPGRFLEGPIPSALGI